MRLWNTVFCVLELCGRKWTCLDPTGEDKTESLPFYPAELHLAALQLRSFEVLTGNDRVKTGNL